jgi:hypothetical protein
MTYADIVARSAERYASHLMARASDFTGPDRALLDAALDLTRHGVRAGGIDLSMLEKVSDAAIEASINPYGLGLGTPDAEVLIVGREPGFDKAAHRLNLLLESIALTALWQAPDRAAATAVLAPKVGHVDFPHEAWRAWPAYSERRRAPHTGQTWSKVGRLFGYAREAGTTPDWQGWTQHAYLTDLGAPPSLMHAGGGTDPVRHAFLAELAANFSMRGTRTLIFMSRSAAQRPGQEAVARAFLGLSAGTALPESSIHALVDTQNKNCVERVAVDRRVVLWTRHLSGTVPNNYLAALSGMLERT